MSSANTSFSHPECIAPRKRYKFGIMDEESDTSSSSQETLSGSETPLVRDGPAFHFLSYATPAEILRQLVMSLVPPLHPSRVLMKPLLDPVGPTIVITFIICLLTYASSKTAPFKYNALEAVIIIGFYMIISSSIVFLLGNLFTGGRYLVSFLQILILLGYSLIGHVLSLLIPFALYSYSSPSSEFQKVVGDSGREINGVMSHYGAAKFSASSNSGEHDAELAGDHASSVVEDLNSMAPENSDLSKSNEMGDTAFLICLPFLAGPATLRVALVLLSPIQSPPGRMILGTILCLCHLILLIILHASFVHPTFQYGVKG